MPSFQKRASVDWLAVWILTSAWATLTGWCLSSLRLLDRVGLMVSLTLFVLWLVYHRRELEVPTTLTFRRVLRSRFVVPKIWAVILVLAFVGGLTHQPNNFDFLTYRFPRVLYWDVHHGWFWIATINDRMNYSGTGTEWLMTPLFVLFKTDRLFFLINFVSYLFLPGLIFSVFTRLGISARVSWWWMWTLPCGYCFILQAASSGNDTLAAVYLLASLHYFFLARGSSSARSFGLSCLSLALATGIKASNVPLFLPWLVCLFFRRKDLLSDLRPPFVALVLVVSVMVSFLPNALLNIHFTGDFAGDPKNRSGLKVSNPVAGFMGNTFQLAMTNLIPPVMPRSIDWEALLSCDYDERLRHDFPRLTLVTGELQIEESAGVGLGIAAFITAFVFYGTAAKIMHPELSRPRDQPALWIVGAGGLALAVYFAKLGSESTARLVSAYYPILIAGCLVLVSADGRVMRRGGLRWWALGAMLSAIPLLVFSPSRPLLPVQGIVDGLTHTGLHPSVIERVGEVYRVYAGRSDAFHDVLVKLPPAEHKIGFLQLGNAPAAALWRPFGARQVVETNPHVSRGELLSQGIGYVVVSQLALSTVYHTDIEFLTQHWAAQVIDQSRMEILVHTGVETWYLVQLKR